MIADNKDNPLNRCPHCGSPAALVCDLYEKTYIAICQGEKCRASIRVHYGRRTASLPLGTLKADNDMAARNKCIYTWNRNQLYNEIQGFFVDKFLEGIDDE